MRLRRPNQKGVSLVELMIATAILATMAASVVVARHLMAVQTVRTDDRAFATQKAIQMFGELKSLISGEESSIDVLDDYDNGSAYDTVLTTDKHVDTGSSSANPADPLSDNRKTDGHWRFLRQVTVTPLVNDSSARLVTVKVWRYAGDNNPNAAGELLSEVGGILRTISTLQNPTQVMDIYFLDINNIQGWWAQVPSLLNTIEGAENDIQSASNDTLQFRPHYITRTSYGRDQQYHPFINKTVLTSSKASPWVYLYPGLVPEYSGGVTTDFYDPSDDPSDLSSVLLDGHFNVDGGQEVPPAVLAGGADYAVADQYNSAVRYPEELATYAAVTAACAAAGVTTVSNPVTELSERMLLESMMENPSAYQNAILINLHGELLPLPPMRNYSDAAKDPANYPDYRLVTHPENLFYPASAGTTVNVNLRVYGYMDGFDDPSLLNSVNASSPTNMPYVSALITLPDLYYDPTQIAALTASAIYGDSATNAYKAYAVIANGPTVGPFAMGMGVISTNSGYYVDNHGNVHTSYTQIILNRVPMRCPQYTGGGTGNGSGLNLYDRLYGLEYIPCSPDATTWSTTFTSKDLTTTSSTTTTSAGNPKNTASWILTLPMPAELANSPQEVDTQILAGPLGVPSTFDRPNLSKTYVWVGPATVASPPYVERYQFMGDPRDCPYLDVKVGGPSTSPILAYSYNWYFKNISNGSTGVDGYKGFLNTSNGWGTSGGVNFDIDLPRFYQMIRTALFNTTSIYGTVNGWSFYYYGMGGELGYDQPPFDHGVSYIQAPWSSTTAGIGTNDSTDEIITETWVAANTKYARIPANVAKTGLAKDAWYAKPWLGELYPDSQYSTFWLPYGNLPDLSVTVLNSVYGLTTPTAADPVTFFREDFANISTGGNSLAGFHGSGNHFGRATDGVGCTSFYNGNFQHQGSGSTGSIYNMAVSCYNVFNYSLSGSVNVNRPWAVSSPSSTPSEWNVSGTNGYSNNRNTLSIPSANGTSELFYNSDQGGSWNGAGVVKVTSPTGQVFYSVESGLSTSANVGTNTLGTYALLFTLRAFLDGGLIAGQGVTGHITQLPLIKASLDAATGQYADPTQIAVTIASPVLDASNHPINDLWFRFPGFTSTEANYYDELYPNYTSSGNNLLSSTYNEMSGTNPVTLLYNVKYSPDNGQTWKFMQDNATATLGTLGTASNEAITVSNSGATPVTYLWDVSDSTAFPQGTYRIQAEAYRLGYGLHYSYHQIYAIIDR